MKTMNGLYEKFVTEMGEIDLLCKMYWSVMDWNESKKRLW